MLAVNAARLPIARPNALCWKREAEMFEYMNGTKEKTVGLFSRPEYRQCRSNPLWNVSLAQINHTHADTQ